MATLKYKTPEGEWKKVSIGGGGSTEEVYVGSDAPTDENVKVWIDPTGTPSSPSQPSAGVEVIDNLESDSTTAALSANQGRVLKEMFEELPSGGGGEGAKMYEVYISPQNDDELAANIKVYNAVLNGEKAIYSTYVSGGWTTAILAASVSSLVSLIFEVSLNASDGSGLTTTQFSIGLDSSGSTILSSESSVSVPSTSEVEKMIANVGGGSATIDTEMSADSENAVQNKVIKAYVDNAVGGAKIYQLPSGLFDSSQDNMYNFTAEEQQSLIDAIMSANTMFFIAIFDEDSYRIINVPLTLEFDLMFTFSGNRVATKTLPSGGVRLTMKIWEIFLMPTGDGAYMRVTEKVIYEA